MSNLTKTGRPRIGGQALIEGVMMNGEKHYSVAVRKPDGEIHTEIFESKSLTNKGGMFKWPIIRGVIRFVESLIIGIKTLEYSADFFVEEPGDAEKKEAAKTEKGIKGWWHRHEDDVAMSFTLILAVALALGLFVLVPMGVSKLLYAYVFRTEHHYLMGLVEGAVRLIMFILYMTLIAKMKDIQRTFEYHGAEHKVIATFEDAVDLTVENVSKRSRFNKRCGTSFLFIVMFVSIIVFSFIQVTEFLPRLLLHLLLVPLIGGLSYEIQRYSAKSDSAFMNALVKPGLWIQRITTNEPDEKEMEVAIASVVKLMETEHPEFLS